MTGLATRNPHDLTLTPENSRFSFDVKPTFSIVEQGGKKLRSFAGVAYTGDIIPNHYWWGNVIFDMASMNVPDKFAALIDHSGSKRAGYVSTSSVSDLEGFKVSGTLLSNEHGTAVANDSDEGFPWQMSVSIDPSTVEEVMPGAMLMVNSREVHGPCVIFRNSKISEVSFTATGWDSNTSAAAMSRGAQQPPPTTGATTMTKEEQERLDAAEGKVTTLTAANTTLTSKITELTEQISAFSKTQREAEVRLLFSETAREFKSDDAEAVELLALPAEAFKAAAKFSRLQFARSKPAETKPVEQPTGFETLFSHVATTGSKESPQTSPESNKGAGLAADAQKRAEAFSKRNGG